MTTLRKSAAWTSAAVVLMFAFFCSGKKQAEQQIQATMNQGTASLEQERAEGKGAGPSESVPAAGDWEEAFRFVRDGIRTEPSQFPLKSPDGVRSGRSGNALEKPPRLAQLLHDKRLTGQLAEGEA